ncbi:MAG: peptidoglycan-binding protein [Ruminococcus flavefaciens]|nr:peptidoglycan-binding protein [Ruminococcus flavefaciens]MCM1229817.1 peptidoglycan-binding protein [Ruminococcus flavefaciens]
MPFSNQQKRQHIAELQRYLHAISLMDRDRGIPTIIPDGIYGAETISAVKAFQREYHLAETGNTDSATWNKVVAVYRGLFKIQPLPYPAFPSESFVCAKGDSGKLVYIIQAILYGMGQSYDNFPDIEVSGNFNDDTERAVMKFQKICSIPQNGRVDSITWNMLVSCSCHGM